LVCSPLAPAYSQLDIISNLKCQLKQSNNACSAVLL
jgi:hypothetical protein